MKLHADSTLENADWPKRTPDSIEDLAGDDSPKTSETTEAEDSEPPQSKGANKYAKQWDEARHPRVEKGSPEGGQFGTKGAAFDPGSKTWGIEGGKMPAHLAKIRIPPAWQNVRVNTDPDAALLVSGIDAKGRQQRIYSDQHHMRQAALKFARTQELQAKAQAIAQENAAAEQADARDVVALLMHTGIRPGSDRDTKGAKQAYGATTLQGEHVVVEGNQVFLRFTGKKGIDLDIPVTDPTMAKMLIVRSRAVGRNGRLFDLNDRQLRGYVKTLDGGGFKPKDFRTLKATTVAQQLVDGMPSPENPKAYKKSVRAVAKRVSKVLGNTPTVALQSYIDPTVFSQWRMAG